MDTHDKGNTAVFGILPGRDAAEAAVKALKTEGFRVHDISLLMPNRFGHVDFAHEKGTKAPEGASTGVASGALIGGALGWLVGIGALAIPGVGPLVAAGPIVAALAGVGVGGAVLGVAGALVGLGFPEYEAKRYEGFLREGGILLSVHADDAKWAHKAKDILESYGAKDIASTTEERIPMDTIEVPPNYLPGPRI